MNGTPHSLYINLTLMEDVIAIVVLADVVPWILWQILLPPLCVICVADGKPLL